MRATLPWCGGWRGCSAAGDFGCLMCGVMRVHVRTMCVRWLFPSVELSWGAPRPAPSRRQPGLQVLGQVCLCKLACLLECLLAGTGCVCQAPHTGWSWRRQQRSPTAQATPRPVQRPVVGAPQLRPGPNTERARCPLSRSYVSLPNQLCILRSLATLEPAAAATQRPTFAPTPLRPCQLNLSTTRLLQLLLLQRAPRHCG